MRLRRQDVHEEKIETQHRGDRFDPDFRRGEPFQPLAAVEQHLQADHAERERRQAEEVEGRVLLGLLLAQQERHRQKMKPVIGRLR